MKKFGAFSFFGWFLLVSVHMAFAPAGVIGDIAAAIREGNARNIARYFDNQVQIVILSKQGTYSKTQAEMVLRDFFSKNKVTSFELIHQGNTPSRGASFAIGNLSTTTQNYRVYYLVKQTGNQFLLQEIKFEKP